MSAADHALQVFHALERLAAQPSRLSVLDVRAKILAVLGFSLTVVSFERYAVAALLPMALFPVLLAGLGRIPWGLIGRSVLLAAPFAILMGMFNPLIDTQVMLGVAGYGVSGGWLSFASILIRFALTVSATLMLVASTGFYPLCHGLAQLGLPLIFTNQLLLLHRYTVVLADEAARMSLARELRSNGKPMPLTVYGPLLGHLLLRALQRAQRIHQAMLSRGFDGQLHHPVALKWQPRDTRFLVLCLGGFVLARTLDLSRLLGQLILGFAQ